MPSVRPNEKWLKTVRLLGCCHCGNRGCEIHAHHVETEGMGLKCADVRVIPLCADCHRKHHSGLAPTLRECRRYLDALMDHVVAVSLEAARLTKRPLWAMLVKRQQKP